MKESTRKDDVRNLSLVWGAGITAGVLTLAMLLRGAEPEVVELQIQADPIPVVEAPVVAQIEPEIEPVPAPEPVMMASGDNRLFGTVTTVRGRTYEGYIRWDKNEGSWADLLDANKQHATTESVSYAISTRSPKVRVLRIDRDRMEADRRAMERDRQAMQRQRAAEERDRAQMERQRAAIEREYASMERDRARMERDVARLERRLERVRDDGNSEAAEALELELRELAERFEQELEDFDFEFEFDSSRDAADGGVVSFRSKGSNIHIAVPRAPHAPHAPQPPVAVVAPRFVTTSISGTSQSGIRFGHVDRLRALDGRSALFTLKSGQEVELSSSATDLGNSMRALVVEQLDGRTVELHWNDVDVIDFYGAPAGAQASNARMYDTMTTRSGESFTGYVTWDIDEIYSDDVLDGEERGYEHEIPFGDIEMIERYSSRSALVTLHGGDELVLDGTNDVNSSNSGITVSDPALGQVKVRWNEFESVRFHEADAHVGYDAFDGGRALQGTVVTRNGESFEGTLIWDRDEARSWEMLNGHADGVEFHVEFSNIASISRANGPRAEVTLLDGRSFVLSGSNDVDGGNRGVLVQSEDGESRLVDWDDVREVRFGG